MKKKILFIVFFVISLSFYKSQEYNKIQLDSLLAHAQDFFMKTPNNAVPLNEKNYKIFKKAGYSKGMIESLYMLSISHLSVGHYQTGLSYAQQTEKQASEIDDYKNISNGLRVSALIYSLLGLHSDAKEMFAKAFSVLDKITDSDDFYETKGNLYNTRIEMSLYSATNPMTLPEYLDYAKKTANAFSKIKNTKIRNNYLSFAYSTLGQFYTEKKMYDSAYYYSNKALEMAKNDGSLHNECIALHNLAYTSRKQKKYEEVIIYLEKLIPLSKKSNEVNILQSSYKRIQMAYKELGNKEKELEYINKYDALTDSLSRNDKSLRETSVQKIALERQERFIDEKEKLYLLIAGICLLSVLIGYFGYKSLVSYRQERKKIEHKEIIIEEKESQLTELKQKVNNAFEEVLELAKKDDSSFLTRFSEVYPDFIRKLNLAYPDLTPGQLKFCALLRLNFSTKEIAYYNNIANRSVEIKKGRLRKQLNISSSEDLNKWMMNL
ncbi:transcriptional regulator [Chryseobacterium sp. IT-36CA2]|uniref:transcriptional regulator n=1 Tax=Chryseobacterium sp. IT-36CA2 TaxID=3026460 RepID=UPI0039E114A4